jgi:hypothetical protein
MNDAFERLQKRARPKVPPRDDSLIKRPDDQKTKFSHSAQSSQPEALSRDEPNDGDEQPEVVRRTVRLESEVDSEIERLCSTSKITREVFLEAAYLVCQENPQVMEEVLALAKARYQQRKAAGEQRKLKTMEKKLRTQEP